MFARVLLCLMFASALPALAQVPASGPQPAPAQLPALEVNVERIDLGDRHVFEVAANGAVRASQAKVWKILTDYERMPEFVPDMKHARVLSRTGSRAIVEQFGVARFLFFRRSIHLIVQVTEQPQSVIEIGLVEGDMQVYRCRWEFTPIPATGGTRIAYTGTMVPRFYVPGKIGAHILRSDIERMMTAVLARLDAGT